MQLRKLTEEMRDKNSSWLTIEQTKYSTNIYKESQQQQQQTKKRKNKKKTVRIYGKLLWNFIFICYLHIGFERELFPLILFGFLCVCERESEKDKVCVCVRHSAAISISPKNICMHAFWQCLLRLLLLYASCVPTKNVNMNNPNCKVHIRCLPRWFDCHWYLRSVEFSFRMVFFSTPIHTQRETGISLLAVSTCSLCCCAFFIHMLMKFSKHIKNFSSSRKIGRSSSSNSSSNSNSNRSDSGSNCDKDNKLIESPMDRSVFVKNKCMNCEFVTSV